MAYLDKEEMKRMRIAIKKQFPFKDGWKLSITRHNYSTINVVFVQAPLNLDTEEKGYYQVNPYYIEDHYSDKPDAMNSFLKVKNAIRSVKIQEDRNAGDLYADYGDTNFFYNISVGQWDLPFKINE